MKKKKATRPRSARLMAADSKLQRESAFQLLSAEWSQTHTEQHGRLIVELDDKGHSLRCIARNLPGPPDESVVRALKNSVKSIMECKQEPKKAVTTEELEGSQLDQPTKPTSPRPPGQCDAPEQAKVVTCSKEEIDPERALAEAQRAKAERRRSPAEFRAEVERRASEALKERNRIDEECRARSKASKSNFLEQFKLKTIL